ncbi:ABC transporter ATP-binding protein [Alkalihalobacillus trypoxylicola]|uniref:ABC transporter n=1 Tax=Alkalihalobacillus trypoxylicola TaxID=519424 RepID=A0A162DEF0_9BACI|nr:ABC transporter ATP-binding protein [Alkalihalobacillus trypoxylicola]KYG29370.1 ABC transporter [Alkalihalobacillus trypoxylicola]
MENELQLDKVSLKIGNKRILEDISFLIEEDKIYGLLGRNGAGKTSLLSILATFRKATSGSATMNNQDIYENAAYLERVIFIRDVKMDEWQVGKRVKNWLKENSRFRPQYDEEYALELLKKFKIDVKEKVYELSRGKQSALHVVLGLSVRAPITIFDEAYLGMDAPAREIFYEEVLKDYMEYPRTFILSTHLISEMESMFEEVLIIDDGKVIIHDSAEALREKGLSITGATAKVESFVKDKKVLKEQVLGGTKRVMIYGDLNEDERGKASLDELELGPITLQELFIHLTKGEEQ